MNEIREKLADLMRFERKDIVKQVPCPDGKDNCQTYHCEVVGHFYQDHDFRVDVEDWKPDEDLNQAVMCLNRAGMSFTADGARHPKDHAKQICKDILEAFNKFN